MTCDEIAIAARDASPFFYDVGSRTIKGAAIGAFTGLVMFRSWRTRKLLTYYGMGVGLGMSYSQLRSLWTALYLNDQAASDQAFYKELRSIEREI